MATERESTPRQLYKSLKGSGAVHVSKPLAGVVVVNPKKENDA